MLAISFTIYFFLDSRKKMEKKIKQNLEKDK